jgi:hypothetical protein
MWESNPPGPFVRGRAGFEVRRGHQAPCPPVDPVAGNGRTEKSLTYYKLNFLFISSLIAAAVLDEVAQLDPVLDAELAVDVRNVFLDGLERDEEPLFDLAIR